MDHQEAASSNQTSFQQDNTQQAHREEATLKQEVDAANAQLEISVPLHPGGLLLDPPHLHAILLLSDSALPLGSFAFSSGLESFLAHKQKQRQTSSSFLHFLDLSLNSLTHTTLPYLLASFNDTACLSQLDNDLDASLSCSVARRASVAQGRALASLWQRSLSPSVSGDNAARIPLDDYVKLLKEQKSIPGLFSYASHANGHLPPLFGAVCASLYVSAQNTIYMFLMNHAKTLLSAAVRASVIGPYQAQAILASTQTQKTLWSIVRDTIERPTEIAHAGQSVPMLDLWGGRHEIVYSRIFNS